MLRFSLLLISVLFIVPARASEVEFIKEDWNKARELAREQNKMLLVDFYTDWCRWCKEMDKNTFPDEAVSDFIGKNFVALSIDAEKGLGIEVALKYRVNVFPSYGYFTPDGKLITKSIGYQPPEEYIKTLQDVAALYAKGSYLKGVTADLNPGFPDFYMAAGGGKGERKMPDEGVADEYLSQQADLFSEVSFSILYRFNTADKYSDFFMDNRERYIELFGKDDVEMKTSSVISGKLRAAIKGKDENLLKQVLTLSDTYESGDREKNRERYTMSYYRGVKDWETYSGMVAKSIEAGGMSDGGVNSAAWAIYEGCDDLEIVKMAAGWMEKTVQSSPTYAYLDTYAALLFKSGDRKLAEEYALKAIDAGKTDKEDVTSTEELLAKIRGQVQ